MSFHPITAGTFTFNQSGVPGRYALSTLAFGDPENSFRISGGTLNRKTGFTNATISRIFELDVTVLGVISRKKCTISLAMQVPQGISATVVDSLVENISEFVTVSNLNRLLNGEQ